MAKSDKKATSSKPAAKKPMAKKPAAKKPATKSPVKKPVAVKAVAKKPIAKASGKKPVAKVPVKKPVAKKPVKKSVSMAPVKKPVAKVPAKKPVAKAPVKKFVSKAPVEKPVAVKPVARKMTLAEVRAAAAAKAAEAEAAGRGRRIRKTDAERMAAPIRKLAAKVKAHTTARKRIAAQMADAAAVRAAEAEKAPEPFIKPPEKKTVRFSKKDLDEFRKELVYMRGRIVGKIKTGSQSSFKREDESNYSEEGAEAYERLLAIGATGSFQQMVYQIDEALESIKNGTYGICKNCGGLIQKPRLQALPFAKNCIRCQSLHERRR